MDWAEIAAEYQLHLVTQAKSGETIRTYLGYCRIVWNWADLRGTDLRAVDRTFVATFLAEASRKHTRNTVRNFTGALRNFFDFCIAVGSRQDNPTKGFSLKKPKHQPKRPMTLQELRDLMAVAAEPIDRALIVLMGSTGLRIGEVVRLRVQDIDWQRQVALLAGKGDKERWVGFDPPVATALDFYLAGRSAGPVFLTEDGRPMSRERARKRLMRLATKAGLAGVYPHRLRTTFANRFLERGGDLGALQLLMGHADIATTARYAGFTAAARALQQHRQMNLGGELLE